ncbi:MAG: single-stranded DNA-binding protein [Clostridiales bacterium]|nr:single-stranded DNA-binding protein [Clostridiales bacterium]
MNKVILMGRLTKDPELRYTSGNNTAVCSFTLAVNRKFSKQGEEKQADFFNIVAWDKQAEFCGKWFEKGRQVAVSGRLQNRTWDDNEGKKHYITEVVAEDCYFADSKKGEGGGTPYQKPAAGNGAGPSDGFYPLDGDDELPF